MAKDRKRDHFMTKEERSELWRQLGERNEASRAKARGAVPQARDYEIRIDDEGKPILMCPWHQELPAGSAPLYFWNVLEELRENLTEKVQDEFLEGLGKSDDASRSMLRAFCEFSQEAAKVTARARYLKHMESIESVRMSMNYYDDKEDAQPAEQPQEEIEEETT